MRDHVDADRNGNISVDEMKTMIQETCSDEVLKRRLTKRDLEGFLSAFKYNNHGGTDIGSIAPLVFEKDNNKITTDLAKRQRANPPPSFVNEDLNTISGLSNYATEDGISDVKTARRLRSILN